MEVPEFIFVSDAVECTFADLDGKSLGEEQKDKHYREWKLSKGADRTDMRKEEKRLRCAGVFAQMCVASCVAWRPRSEPWRVTSGVARAHHDGCGAASPGRDTNTGHLCAAHDSPRAHDADHV